MHTAAWRMGLLRLQRIWKDGRRHIWRDASRSSLARIALLAGVAALAVAAFAIVTDPRGPVVSAQSGGISSAASCGGGNPLDGRTQRIVDVIVAELQDAGTLTAAQTCNDVTDIADLAGITGTLNFSRDGLTQIRARDFDGLSGVTSLFLGYNSFTTIPVDAFVGLSAVTTLRIEHNRLTSVPVGAFNGLSAMRNLYSGFNDLTTLPATVLSASTLSALETIDLQGNHFRSLPSTVFQGLPALEAINLDDNYLTSDGLGFLATALPTLERLYLRDNVLSSDGTGPDPDLPTNIFGIHPNLVTLYLSNNKIVELPTGVFSGMSSVSVIHLGNNRIARLQDGVLNGVTWSTSAFSGTIYFTGNLIRTVDEDFFNDGPCGTRANPMPTDPDNCMVNIYLDYNVIESLPADLFDGMTALRSVRLQGNRLTTLPSGLFDSISAMSTVYLNDNLLESLPARIFASLTSLSRVYLENNRFTSLPANVFDGLPKHTSGPNMGLLQRPTVVYLWGNQLDATAQAAVTALFPSSATIRFEPFTSTTTRTVPTLGGTREVTANCGPGHTLTGRTREVVWRIMRAAYANPNAWRATFTSSPQPPQGASWSSTVAAWQTLHGTTPAPGDPPAIDPAYCNLITANDLLRVRSLSFFTQLVSLESTDFAGLSNLNYLHIERWGPHRIRELPEGIFNGLTKLRYLSLWDTQLLSLRPGVFDGLTNLRTLRLRYNFLTTLPAGVFDDLINLRILELQQNRINELPPGIFSNLRQLRELSLHLNELDEDDLPVGTFNGLSELRELYLWGNNFRTLYLDVFLNQGLSKLRLLRIGDQNADRTSPQEFGAFQQSLPALTRLDRLPGAQLIDATPTPVPPTPTATTTPTFHERLQLPFIAKVVPTVRELTVSAGDEVRLSFEMYNVQDRLDNDLFMHDSLRIQWTDSGEGTFTESPGSGADRDGNIDDREVVWRAPQLPGRHTVTANITPDWACNGSATECAVVFTVMVVRAAASATPEPTPCPTSGTVPTSLTDADGAAYSVITPAEGGEFVGDDVTVSAPRGAVPGCDYIGLRAYAVAEEGASTRARYGNWTVGGMRYTVDAASSAGVKLANLATSRPIDVCVPLPDEFRASLTGLTLLREVGSGVQELTSKVRRDAAMGYMLCGAVSEFPAVVVAASRGNFGDGMAQPTPTPEAETPDAGGAVPPSTAYVLLALVLGVLAVVGAMRLAATRN